MALLLSAIKVNCVVSVCELIVDQEQERWSLVSVRADCLDSAPQNMKQMNFSQWHTHGKYTMSMKHWSMIGGNHCSSTTNNIIFCSLWHFLIWSLWEHDLIIEASPICNNLPAIVILKVSFLDWRINCGSVPSPLATFHCILSFLLFCETEAKLRIWPALPDKGREAPQPT